MNSLSIHTTDEMAAFGPRSRLSGVVSWSLEAPPTAIELELVWQTRGKGTTDSQVVDSLRFETPPKDGQREFSFDLPDSPYSFHGKLISLLWSLRLTAHPADESAEFSFTLSPGGRAIDLYAAGDPPKRP